MRQRQVVSQLWLSKFKVIDQIKTEPGFTTTDNVTNVFSCNKFDLKPVGAIVFYLIKFKNLVVAHS